MSNPLESQTDSKKPLDPILSLSPENCAIGPPPGPAKPPAAQVISCIMSAVFLQATAPANPPGRTRRSGEATAVNWSHESGGREEQRFILEAEFFF